jgi:hypothetical protein
MNLQSDKAVKNAWRFVGLVYLLMIIFFAAGPTAQFWAPADLVGAMFVTMLMLFSLMLAFCFALAAFGWALWSFRKREKNDRRPVFIVLAMAVLTTAILGGYILIFTGAVRLW